MKVAVVIFNLGGPDKPSAIRPFLFNLFNDPLIISLPWFLRTPLAYFISKTRAPKVAPLYDRMGGRSPIQPNTEAQAKALQAVLNTGEHEFKIFTAQRYWHPMVDQVANDVKAYQPDQIILLPLYPQLSTTTTTSFVRVWDKAAQKIALTAPVKIVCCYPTLTGFIEAQAELIKPHLEAAKKFGKPRILFSAHGLPEKIVKDRGDPYPMQVQQTAAAIVQKLNDANIEWLVSYQSRVGRLEWIKPYTEAEIKRAGRDGVPLIIVPVAFVSEHLETLVELDVEYRHVAEDIGVPYYGRVPAVGVSPAFIASFGNLVKETLKTANENRYYPDGNQRHCPVDAAACPCKYS